jgi:hypothetical protein
MKPSRKQIWGLVLVGVSLILLTLLSAPGGTGQQHGSTYGRTPDGYGAWYTYMQRQGTPVRRWQKPFDQLLVAPNDSRRTLIQVSDENSPAIVTSKVSKWVAKGNVLILLGVRVPVTKAPFTSFLNHATGSVMVETRRRDGDSQSLLKDEYGSVVWESAIEKGKVIYASTPYLAANAYQNRSGNFALLAELAKEPGYPIWVDEYLHGYKDPDIIAQETEDGDFLTYLAKTPLALLAIQAAVMLLIAIFGQRRLGAPIALTNSAIANSEAYIQAMAQVLRKAECSEFVVEAIAKAERQEIQTALGLGSTLLSDEKILEEWVQQTRQPATQLKPVLNLAAKPQRLDEVKLEKWVQTVQAIRRLLPNSQTGAR